MVTAPTQLDPYCCRCCNTDVNFCISRIPSRYLRISTYSRCSCNFSFTVRLGVLSSCVAMFLVFSRNVNTGFGEMSTWTITLTLATNVSISCRGTTRTTLARRSFSTRTPNPAVPQKQNLTCDGTFRNNRFIKHIYLGVFYTCLNPLKHY